MDNQILSLIEKFGKSSNSFLLLYEGFKYYKIEVQGYTAAIAYTETHYAWVAAAEPLCKEEDTVFLLESFLSAAKKVKKIVLMLPVSEKIASLASHIGYSFFQVGSEPFHSLALFHSPKAQLLKHIPVAKQLLSKGAVVESFNPFLIDSKEYVEIQEFTQKWLDSKKSEPLGFLNRVEPWAFSTLKKFFWIKFQGHILGYLAAVPIPAKNSWYLIDLIRAPDSLPGTTELLVIEAMELLKNEGAFEVTLGMSPLALMNYKGDKFSLIDLLSEKIFENSSFYNFKTLYLYKQKFKPHRWDPVYLLISGNKFSFKVFLSLFSAIYPLGVMHTVKYSLLRFFKRIDCTTQIENTFSTNVVIRPFEFKSWIDFFGRTKVVMSIVFINLILFLASIDNTYQIRSRMSARYGFQWSTIIKEGFDFQLFQTILISSFLHWNFSHLFCNLLLLFIVGGILEISIGSSLVCSSYVLGIFFSNFITSFFFQIILPLVNYSYYLKFLNEVDLGCSLGVCSVLGSFLLYTKFTYSLTVFIVVCVVGYSIGTSSFMALNHLFALLIGYIYAKFYFKNSQIFI